MVNLQDICLRVSDGKHGDCQNEEGSGYFFISCKDVKDGRIDYSSARQITETDYRETHRRTQLEPDDILITNSGTIGRIAIVPNTQITSRTTFQKSVAMIKPNQDKVFPKWLYYYLLAKKDELVELAGGTAQKNLLLEDLRKFQINLVPFPTQRKISAILSPYDDLIANNMKRINVLEEIARNVFNEWFVHFRFPGHQTLETTQMPEGSQPKGWTTTTLSMIVENVKETEKAGDHLRELAYIPIDCIGRKKLLLDRVESGKEARSSLIRFAKYDILFGAMRSYFHKVAIAPSDGITRTTCFVLRPRSPLFYCYAVMTLFQESTVQYANSRSKGSTIPYAVWENGLADMPIILPDENTLEKFNLITMPIVEDIVSAHFRIGILRNMRDILLPRLISGKIDARNLNTE